MNHVDREHAELLKGPWEEETEKVWIELPNRPLGDGKWETIWALREANYGKWHSPESWLPAPSIGELRAQIQDDYFAVYFRKKIANINSDAMDFAIWLLGVTADANLLADIWLWVHRKEAP